MSRRTAPLYPNTSPRLTTFTSSRRYPHGHSLLPLHLPSPHTPAKPNNSPLPSIFDALDNARFDQLRRAVITNPASLSSLSSPRNALASVSNNGNAMLNVVDYALNNCKTWMALLQHCHRTGIAVPHLGELTFRERLAAMDIMIVWMLDQDGVPLPREAPLHTAVQCELDGVVQRLVAMEGGRWARVVDGRGKSALHVVAGLVQRMPGERGVRYVSSLCRGGGEANATDMEGRTAMHELVGGVGGRVNLYGLVRRRAGIRGLAGVEAVVEELLKWGGDLYHRDRRGVSAIEMAVAKGLGYGVLVDRSNWIFENVVGGRWRAGSSDGNYASMGMWRWLPEEVVWRIVGFLSPRDAVCGLGATCVGLRRTVVAKHAWLGYSRLSVMEEVRRVLRKLAQDDRRGESILPMSL